MHVTVGCRCMVMVGDVVLNSMNMLFWGWMICGSVLAGWCGGGVWKVRVGVWCNRVGGGHRLCSMDVWSVKMYGIGRCGV